MSDLTLDELRLALVPEIASAAAFDGWSDEALIHAANTKGVDIDVARLAFPGGGMEMIEAWIDSVDAAMETELTPESLGKLKIRDRIRALIAFRLGAVTGMEESLRRAQAVMAMPNNAAKAMKMGWGSADKMWRLAGDNATDYNHYTKRAILAGIYAATLAVFIDDNSEGKVETNAFLDRRIEGVMKFEKAKARLLNSDRDHFSVSRFLGRLRYPAK